MATVGRWFRRNAFYDVFLWCKNQQRPFIRSRMRNVLGLTAASGCLLWYCFEKDSRTKVTGLPVVFAARSNVDSEVDSQAIGVALSQRERRFQTFATREYKRAIYMTPQDFLDSVCHEEPKAATLGRVVLSEADMAELLAETPTRKDGSSHLFRTIRDKGIISYTEYLFLLCVLTKPRTGFRIAFNMFDTDGNAEVDKKEFLVMEKTLSRLRDEKAAARTPTSKSGSGKPLDDVHHDDSSLADIEIPGENHEDTTLLVHLFSTRGDNVLNFHNFCKFMENLQTEVLEVEFQDYAQGKTRITEIDFARLLLRYTSLSSEEMDQYTERLNERIPDGSGICFTDFRDFALFLNHLEDFNIAVGLYTLAGLAVSQDEFKRAVKVCTDIDLDDNLVNIVFQIFDSDGDGSLSHREFMSIMKNRLHRQAKIQDKNLTLWEGFKVCLKDEMRYS